MFGCKAIRELEKRHLKESLGSRQCEKMDKQHLETFLDLRLCEIERKKTTQRYFWIQGYAGNVKTTLIESLDLGNARNGKATVKESLD